jgi:predicted regulator of Ras-like GTPase activity (Roadblock/LC7/MglB family)
VSAEIGWLVTSLAARVPDVVHAAVVSSDGLPLATSAGFPLERADQLAAITSGLAGLTAGASQVLDVGPIVQAVVQLERGTLIVIAVSKGACLVVLASTTDLGLTAYEMTLLAERMGRLLTPAPRNGTGSQTSSPDAL